MKKHSSPLFFSSSFEERANQTMENDDASASGFNLPHHKIFTAADLWNIQRQRRAIRQRRLSL
jgi:hypothetical protein